MSILACLADPCPACHPGDCPAVLPFLVAQQGGMLRAWYKHGPCFASWECSWDAEDPAWPMLRHVRPVRDLPRAPEPLGALLDELIGALAGLFGDEETAAA